MNSGVLLLLALAASASGSSVQAPAPSEEARTVSLVQLIATPERFEGKVVRVIGVLEFGHEEHALYLHQEDRQLLNYASAVWLDLTGDYRPLAGSFALAEGRFTAKKHGHMGVYPGALENVRRLERWRTRGDRRPHQALSP